MRRSDKRPAGIAIAAVIFAAASTAPAAAQESWAHVEGFATAELPAPSGDPSIVGGTLACAEQKWMLSLAAAPGTRLSAGPAVLAVDGNNFDTKGETSATGLDIAVPLTAIDPLRAGLRLTVTMAGRDEPAVFSLRGSRRAIDAAEPLCSPRSMAGYDRILPTPFSSYVKLAASLRDEEVKAFRTATASDPKVAAAMLEIDDKRRFLLVEMCGSSWYFGRSGCNLAGFVPDEGEPGWRLALDTEGAALYADFSDLNEGWPGLIAVPNRGAGPDLGWRWDGGTYVLTSDESGPAED